MVSYAIIGARSFCELGIQAEDDNDAIAHAENVAHEWQQTVTVCEVLPGRKLRKVCVVLPDRGF